MISNAQLTRIIRQSDRQQLRITFGVKFHPKNLLEMPRPSLLNYTFVKTQQVSWNRIGKFVPSTIFCFIARESFVSALTPFFLSFLEILAVLASRAVPEHSGVNRRFCNVQRRNIPSCTVGKKYLFSQVKRSFIKVRRPSGIARLSRSGRNCFRYVPTPRCSRRALWSCGH